MLKTKFLLIFLLIASFAVLSPAQSLPEGKWRLVTYSFAGNVAPPLPWMDITLNIHAEGKIGGKSGCNTYGGDYAVKDDKLKISDIISTMMACDDSSPQFEHSFYDTLTGASEVRVRKGLLTLTDPQTHNYLRFTLDKK